MERPIDRGTFVEDTQHPEYGVGRVLNAGAFSTRVLFSKGGVRVFRVDDADKLRTCAPPSKEQLEALAAKEATLLPRIAPAKPTAGAH